MAIKSCKECGKEISTKADKCPYCGAPNKQGEIGLIPSLLIIGIVIYFASKWTSVDESPTEGNKKQTAIQQKKLKEVQKSKKDEFLKYREKILSENRTLIAENKLKEAINNLNIYSHIGDQDLDSLISQAKEKQIYQKAIKIPASNLKENRDAYQELANLNPNQKLYKKKLIFYQGKLDKQKEEELLRKVKGVPAHHLETNKNLYRQLVNLDPKNKKYKTKYNYYKNKINYFGKAPVKSAWDGSYSPVRKHLEVAMHDPDSLDFEGCTEVLYNKNGWVVGCIYRGNNLFGAKVKNANWFLIRHNTVVKVFDADRFKWK